MDEGDSQISTDRARAGQSPHVVRYVLVISMVLIVVLFGVILFAWS